VAWVGKSNICHGGEGEPSFGPVFNPLNAELNPICHLLALLGAHHILHVSRLRVKINIEGLLSSVKRLYIYFSTVLYVVLKYCCLDIHYSSYLL
jgi:hypothetical protein